MQPTRWSFTPAVEDILSPPPVPPPDPPPAQIRAGADQALGFVVTVANILVTIVIIVGMIVESKAVGRSILTGALYFATTTAIYVLALTGTLTDVIRGGQQQRTERLRIDAYADLAEQAIQWRLLVEENRKAELETPALPGDLAGRLSDVEQALKERTVAALKSDGETFVTPYDNRSRAALAAETQPARDTTANEARAWAMGLYTDMGLPNPKCVQLTGKREARGKIIGEVIGSKRGEGSSEALLWLLNKGVLLKVPGGYALNLRDFARRERLREIR